MLYQTAQEKRNLLVQERERIFKELQSVPFLEPYPSSSNFVLCKVKGAGKDAKGIKDALAKQVSAASASRSPYATCFWTQTSVLAWAW